MISQWHVSSSSETEQYPTSVTLSLEATTDLNSNTVTSNRHRTSTALTAQGPRNQAKGEKEGEEWRGKRREKIRKGEGDVGSRSSARLHPQQRCKQGQGEAMIQLGSREREREKERLKQEDGPYFSSPLGHGRASKNEIERERASVAHQAAPVPVWLPYTMREVEGWRGR